MTGPRFSLVVPTRNRPRTLESCLRTCLAQSFDDFEVVVSDNHSPPETREVALSSGDPRIKYFRTPADLSVTDSFEFALEKATGEYVMLLGDDDGCLLHALAEIDKLLKAVRTSALHWSPVLYSWPDIADETYAAANTLVVPLRQSAQGCALQRYESAPMIEAAANGDISYARLPMAYCCAVVHRDAFQRLRERAGRVFKSRAPDVYAAFAVAHVVEAYHSIAAPMTISGTSVASTGLAYLRQSGSAIDAQFRGSSERAGHLWHGIVPDLPSLHATVADSVLHFEEALAPDSVAIDRRRLVQTVLADMVIHSEPEWREALAACRRSVEDDAELLAWFDTTQAIRSPPADLAASRQHAARRYGGTFLALDASEHGVSDVYGAAALCERLLGYRRDGIAWAPRECAALGESLSELQAKERKILEMHELLRAQDQQLRDKDQELRDKEDEINRQVEHVRALDAQARELLAQVQAAAPRRGDGGFKLRMLVPRVVRRALRAMRGGQ